MSTPTLHAVVHGRVQGVFFRAGTRDEAERLGVGGWVRNLPDGTVEVYAEGDRDRLDRLHAWLRRGTTAARVTQVDVDWSEHAQAASNRFEITG